MRTILHPPEVAGYVRAGHPAAWIEVPVPPAAPLRPNPPAVRKRRPARRRRF